MTKGASVSVLTLAAVSVLGLAACQPAPTNPNSPDVREGTAAEVAELSQPAAAADAAAQDAPTMGMAPNRATTAGGATSTTATPEPLPVQPPQPPAPIARIAYAYRYVMSVPRDRGAELMSRHELACASAGPGYCQVVSAQADWVGSRPSGELQLRGQPQWIDRFRAGLATDVQNSGGSLDEAVTEGEDVTAGIAQTTAGVKTAETLTQRIQALQAQRGGTMAQRLEVERQLAELMRQRDQQALELQELETRVQTATLTLNYRQGGAFGANNPTSPVAHALQNAFGLSMGMLAVLITIGSVLLPVAVIGGIVWWAIVRRRKPVSA